MTRTKTQHPCCHRCSKAHPCRRRSRRQMAGALQRLLRRRALCAGMPLRQSWPSCSSELEVAACQRARLKHPSCQQGVASSLSSLSLAAGRCCRPRRPSHPSQLPLSHSLRQRLLCPWGQPPHPWGQALPVAPGPSQCQGLQSHPRRPSRQLLLLPKPSTRPLSLRRWQLRVWLPPPGADEKGLSAGSLCFSRVLQGDSKGQRR